MGNGASKRTVDQTEVLSECPILVDLGHGTIRHRENARINNCDKNQGTTQKMKKGYFYHARLKDYSQGCELRKEEEHKLNYVFRGPNKDNGKRLYYVYGNSFDAVDNGIKESTYRPKGKGFTWPEVYRKANHLYYNLTVQLQTDEPTDYKKSLAATESVSDDASTVPSSELSKQQRDHMVLKRHIKSTIADLKQHLSFRLLKPVNQIHLIHETNDLRNTETLCECLNVRHSRSGAVAIELHLE